MNGRTANGASSGLARKQQLNNSGPSKKDLLGAKKFV